MSETCPQHGTKLYFQPIDKDAASKRQGEIQAEYERLLNELRENKHLSGRGRRERAQLSHEWEAARGKYLEYMALENPCDCTLAAIQANLLVMSLAAGQLSHIH